VHKNNVRRRKAGGNLNETIRIASMVQKGVDAGRSSHVEMQALSKIASQNIRSKVRSLQTSMQHKDNELSSILDVVSSAMSEGYMQVLEPNGKIRRDRLDAILSVDADIVTCLAIIDEEIKSSKPLAKSTVVLKELVKQRKELVDASKA
jgi:hypothetical protein